VIYGSFDCFDFADMFMYCNLTDSRLNNVVKVAASVASFP
jgi:hypothetical protein